jgi:hypothetical protein
MFARYDLSSVRRFRGYEEFQGNSKGNDNDKSKGKMRGFFAALRMTGVWGREKRTGKDTSFVADSYFVVPPLIFAGVVSF